MDTEPSEADRLFAQFARTGDARALGEAYDELAPELLRLALHTCPDAATAEDVLQATFVAAIERVEHFDPARPVLPWLIGILAHEARKVRARAGRALDPSRLDPAPALDPAAEAEQAELRATLDSALEHVPLAFRPVLRLRLRHGLSVAEIAAALERPPGTVRSQLARATALLRRSLPAGLVPALSAFAVPTRGLAEVRARLLEHAAAHQATWSAATTLAGVVAVKKLVAVAAVLLALLLGWNALRSEGPVPPEAPAAVVAAEAAELPRSEPPAAPRSADRTTNAVEQREPLPSVPAQSPPEVAPAPRAAVLRVRADWWDGTPAAGEVVLVTPHDARPDESVARVTDADGVALFADLGAGSALVRLLRGGEESVVLDGETDRELRLTIHAGVTIDGRVVDLDGEPVSGAEVWLSERYRNDLGHVVAKSDETGRFRLRAVSADHYLGARRSGFEPSPLRSARGAAGDVVALELRLGNGGADLRGRVMDERGATIEGAWVLAGEEQPRSLRISDGSFVPAAPPQRVRTDTEGRYELAGLAAGPQPVQARARGFAPLRVQAELVAGDANELVLVLRPEARLVGTVRTAGGEPLAGARVLAVAGDAGNLFAGSFTWSGIDGSFVLARLGTEHVLARADHPEHGHAERELAPVPGARIEWDVVLRPEPAIVGRIEDAHGAPLAGLVVVALPGADPGRRSRSERSDTDGRFQLGDLEDCAHLLWVQRPLGWRGFPLAELADVRPGDPPVRLVVPDESEHGRIALEVAAEDGTPLVGAELAVWHEERHLWRSFASMGTTGTVLAEWVPPGTVTLDLRHPDHPWKALGEHRVEPGATLDLGRITLAAAGRLRVHFSGLDPESVGLQAMLAGTENRESGVAALESGVLASGPLAPGEHTLVLTGVGVRQVRRTFAIQAGVETSLSQALEACPVREVVLESPAGAAPPRWIHVSLLAPDGTLAWSGAADCTRTPPVARVSAPAGVYRVRAEGLPGLAGETELVMPALGTELPAQRLQLLAAR